MTVMVTSRRLPGPAVPGSCLNYYLPIA